MGHFYPNVGPNSTTFYLEIYSKDFLKFGMIVRHLK